MFAIGGGADSVSGGSAMTDKSMQLVTDKGMMGKGEGMTKDGTMPGGQRAMEKR
jgi:hypothetical protein